MPGPERLLFHPPTGRGPLAGRCLVLWHGAGGDVDQVHLVAVADAVAAAGGHGGLRSEIDGAHLTRVVGRTGIRSARAVLAADPARPDLQGGCRPLICVQRPANIAGRCVQAGANRACPR